MIYMHTLLWIFIFFFAVIGLFRGAAKELLVTISLLIALFILSLLGTTDFFKVTLATMENGLVLFWVRISIIGILTLAGYQTPNDKLNFKTQIAPNDKVEKLSGFLIGALNGFLIVGTLWFFLDAANYPGDAIFGPLEGPNAVIGDKALNFLEFLPPAWLEGTVLYVVVAFLVMFILVMII